MTGYVCPGYFGYGKTAIVLCVFLLTLDCYWVMHKVNPGIMSTEKCCMGEKTAIKFLMELWFRSPDHYLRKWSGLT